MNIIERIREWLWGRESTRAEAYFPFQYETGHTYDFIKALQHDEILTEFRLVKLKEEIKNLQLSILIAKKQKKKTSHFYAEMARIQAEVLKLEAM